MQKYYSIFLFTIILMFVTASVIAGEVHTFYYPWYGNVEIDGSYRHWNHEVLGVRYEQTFPGGDDIGADFYPELGCYSSNDTTIITKHMKQMRDAGIDVVVLSWWGKDSFEDKLVPSYLKYAHENNLKICFHLEPFYKSVDEAIDAVNYLIDSYQSYPAYYRYNDLPMIYVYDSYLYDENKWADYLVADSSRSVRGTRYDAYFIALIVDPTHKNYISSGGFNGGYSYFASDGFSYASNSKNWDELMHWFKEYERLFLPSVGPGYSDLRIRPWNNASFRSRENGDYYRRMFARAISIVPEIINITSFNEWHEGTQIEPAKPKKNSFTYNDYSPKTPDYYLNLTKQLIDEYRSYNYMDSNWRELIDRRCAYENLNHLGLGKLLVATRPHRKYLGNGLGIIVDGVLGSTNYLDGCWLGYQNKNIEFIIDLGEVKIIDTVTLRFLRNEKVAISLPKKVELFFSDDNISYQLKKNCQPEFKATFGIFTLYFSDLTEPTRYVKVKISSYTSGNHLNYSQPNDRWIFIDEIIIK